MKGIKFLFIHYYLLFQLYWFFSTAMHPIDTWKLDVESIGKVAEHLKECPYNVRNDHMMAKRKTTKWDEITDEIKSYSIKYGLRKSGV